MHCRVSKALHESRPDKHNYCLFHVSDHHTILRLHIFISCISFTRSRSLTSAFTGRASFVSYLTLRNLRHRSLLLKPAHHIRQHELQQFRRCRCATPARRTRSGRLRRTWCSTAAYDGPTDGPIPAAKSIPWRSAGCSWCAGWSARRGSEDYPLVRTVPSYGHDFHLTLRRMGELEPWIDENFVRSVWFGMGYQVNVKMIRDKFSGSEITLLTVSRHSLTLS